jgi:glycosyltransferase involved in cell wall biosynthesis
VTNSRAVERDALELAPGLTTRVVYNGIDLEDFRPGPTDRAGLAELAGLPAPPAEACIVGLVATYAWWKGHRTFLNAAARLRAAEPDRALRFYVVGGPIYGRSSSELAQSDLKRWIRELGLDGHVGLVPFQTDAAAVYRGLDVVVHASDRPEPFGRTIAEGMASGRPVVVARAGGAVELFREGESALGHEPGNADDLAGALRRLVRDAPLREHLSRGARAEAEARFDRRRLGRDLHDAYAALLAGGLR